MKLYCKVNGALCQWDSDSGTPLRNIRSVRLLLAATFGNAADRHIYGPVFALIQGGKE